MLLVVCQLSCDVIGHEDSKCHWCASIVMFWVGGILIRLCSLVAVWSFVMSSSFFALSSFGTLTLFDIQYLRGNTVWCSDLTCTLQGYEGVTIATSKTEAGFVQVVLTDQENGMKLGLMVYDMICFPPFCLYDDILTEPEYVKFIYHK